MKNVYPTGLISRPDHIALNKTDIRIGDTVYLQPKNGPRMAGTVIFSSPVHGCTTYTADAHSQDANVRFRFRLQDVHHVAPRHPMPALN
ncbi:hypothetical protein [Alcaligenes aquatilis]|uniref:Uncharacterized protein n=1 Tax=Alcaligenes aquatilis TaxID=323284 RepID=A0ABY4NLJ6_9BURK|nr:hypothetical protein [Alcaligenes aquatilis]AWG34158.1 hypothetical protein CA948_02955 [Alcaligenes aquatilis]UQN37369.1 hypothetical protein MTR80_06585 [Alcaligenes aquatilis]